MAHGQGVLSAPQTFVAAQIDACVAAIKQQVIKEADKIGISAKELERQLRLHLPAVEPALLHPSRHQDAYDKVLPIALARAMAIQREQGLIADSAQLRLLQGADYWCRRGFWLEAADAPPLLLRFERLKPSIGFHYQAEMHYLRALRGDTHLHFGLFLPGAESPIAYIALSRCDRPYMIDGLPLSGYEADEVVVLTRMYGLPGLPANVMSLMTKHVIRAVREASRARVMLTAYNPLLGFTGSVYRASGFREFAAAPVCYGYDDRGHYTTRRLATSTRLSDVETPPNMLMARGLDRVTQAELTAGSAVVRISDHDYWCNVLVAGRTDHLEATLERLIRSLKSAWSDERNECWSERCNGQCDVSSVWIVRELKRLHQIQAMFCYGTVFWSEPEVEYQHCHSWVEIMTGEDTRLVIDVARQFHHASGGQPGMCKDHRLLANWGIQYEAVERLTIDQLPTHQKVWSRFEVLDDALHRRQGVTHDSVS
ncbi:hypothetical protein [Kribbella sp. CA-247076]|uniref:Mom family adenine methylcarbamoylation protein n=1 Tax=Kribbella sp. CA-247076 TaxID=3239941 RepID=UPI003D8DA311